MSEIKNIKNVRVSYPDEYTNKAWDELNARKERLLRSSDWTQLDDCGLSEGCIESWNTWRDSIRALNRKKLKNINKANKMLEHIRAVQPNVVYVKKDFKVDTSKSMRKIKEHEQIITSLNADVKNLKKDLSEMASIFLAFRKENQEVAVEEPVKVIVSEKMVLNRLKLWYSNELSDILEFPLNVVMERCEQAIDYKVSHDEEMSPLVQLHSTIHDKKCDEISDMFIVEKKTVLTKLGELDKQYYKLKNKVLNVKTVDTLIEIYDKLDKK